MCVCMCSTKFMGGRRVINVFTYFFIKIGKVCLDFEACIVALL